MITVPDGKPTSARLENTIEEGVVLAWRATLGSTLRLSGDTAIAAAAARRGGGGGRGGGNGARNSTSSIASGHPLDVRMRRRPLCVEHSAGISTPYTNQQGYLRKGGSNLEWNGVVYMTGASI